MHHTFLSIVTFLDKFTLLEVEVFNMNHTSKKWTKLLLTTTMVIALMTACSSNGDNPTIAPNEATPTQATTGTNTGTGETNSPAEESANPVETKQAEGEYVGQADSHTVEIRTANGSASYQHDEGLLEVITELATGDRVWFEYTVTELEGDTAATQLTLTTIKKEDISGGKGTQSKDTTQTTNLPATKEFTLNLEGMEEVRTATLAQGDGYALYVFEHFSFDAKSNRLMMDIDNRYYVDIQKLPSSYKLEDIKIEAEEELASVGEVLRLEGEEINPDLGGASLFLIGSNDQLIQEIIVKVVDGTGYLFHVNMPRGEASEGFGPLVFTSLSSITNQ